MIIGPQSQKNGPKSMPPESVIEDDKSKIDSNNKISSIDLIAKKENPGET